MFSALDTDIAEQKKLLT